MLFDQPRFRHVRRDELVLPGTWSPWLLVVEAARGLSQAHKGIYRAGLHHLRGGATSVIVTSRRLAAMEALGCRTVELGLAALHKTWLLDAWRRRRAWVIGYAPIDWWLRERSRLLDADLPERLLELYENETAVVQFIDAAMKGEILDPHGTQGPRSPIPNSALRSEAPRFAEQSPQSPTLLCVAKRHASQSRVRNPHGTQGPQDSAPRPAAAPPEASPETAQNLRDPDPPGAESAPNRAESAPNRAESALLKQSYREQSSARARSASPATYFTAQTERQDRVIRLAETWEELLVLQNRKRTEEQEDRDFNELLAVAQDLIDGRLGRPDLAAAQLQTLAHQIGRRERPANRPLGMFLADGVGPMRRRNYGSAAPSAGGAK